MTRSGPPIWMWVLVVVLACIIIGLVMLLMRGNGQTSTSTAPTAVSGKIATTTPAAVGKAPPTATPAAAKATTPVTQQGGFPLLATKPQPHEATFQGCPPEGDDNSTGLNTLKNRDDNAASYYPVDFDTYVNLATPDGIGRKQRANFTAAQKAEVAKYEGVPVAVEGYLAGARAEGPESTNCHGTDASMVDYHVWFTKGANGDRAQSVVVEVTPRIHAQHPAWTTALLGQIVKNDNKVRISGWSMLDQEHPEQLGQTRGTLWEIHPIMQIEVQDGGKWITLDEYAKKK
ncbi:MAG: hypothetical protein U0641_11030 [Anaerolineae bacterium]